MADLPYADYLKAAREAYAGELGEVSQRIEQCQLENRLAELPPLEQRQDVLRNEIADIDDQLARLSSVREGHTEQVLRAEENRGEQFREGVEDMEDRGKRQENLAETFQDMANDAQDIQQARHNQEGGAHSQQGQSQVYAEMRIPDAPPMDMTTPPPSLETTLMHTAIGFGALAAAAKDWFRKDNESPEKPAAGEQARAPEPTRDSEEQAQQRQQELQKQEEMQKHEQRQLEERKQEEQKQQEQRVDYERRQAEMAERMEQLRQQREAEERARQERERLEHERDR